MKLCSVGASFPGQDRQVYYFLCPLTAKEYLYIVVYEVLCIVGALSKKMGHSTIPTLTTYGWKNG